MSLAGARIDQVLPNLSPGDAASDACLAFGRMLAAAGADTALWSSEIHPERASAARRFDPVALRKRAPDLVLFHYATGSDVASRLRGSGVPYAVYFHNVTPPRYFLGANDLLAGLVWRGLAEVSPLVRDARLAIAPSRFSVEQLEAGGAARTRLVPLPFDPAEHADPPDPDVLARFDDGRTNLLFVGRIAPNKRQDELLRLFRYYARAIDASARLLLVGSQAASPAYAQWLTRAVSMWSMDDVHLPGHVTPPARTAYYRVARVLVSASEHEGFGLPMVEAMHHGVPVVARGAAAVGETVGDGGLVVGPGSIERFAEVVAMAAEPGDLRTRLIEAGQRRVEAFAPARVAAELTTAVTEALAR